MTTGTRPQSPSHEPAPPATPAVPSARHTSTPLLARPWPWVLLLGLSFAIPVARLATRHGGDAREAGGAPPVLWPVPAWQLVGQDGRPFGSEQLRGRVYVADFVFTSCTTACPLLTQRMTLVQGRLREYGDRVHLVSISIDPHNDTPERLRAFAERWRADPSRWTFASGGDDASVLRLVGQGFRLGLELPPRRADGTMDPNAVMHADKFVLVDPRGQMRGAYDPDPEGIDRLVRDARAVLAESH